MAPSAQQIPAPVSKAPVNAVDPNFMPEVPPKEANEPVRISPSQEERIAGKWSDKSLKIISSGMYRDGVVLLENMIEPEHLDKINGFIAEDMESELKKENLHRNFGVENIQQAPPLHPPEYFFDDVYVNKLLFHAVTLVLGPKPRMNLISGNNALPRGTNRQPPHSDAMGPHPCCPHYLIANTFTCDAGPENGVTEVWLGTHHYNCEAQCPKNERGVTQILDEFLDERRKTLPGIQPRIKKGTILLRDLRLWHAGMPNTSDAPRFMIATGFSAPWHHGSYKLRVPDGTGVFERFQHGTKDSDVIPWLRLVSPEEYEAKRNVHDFGDAETQSYEGEIY